MRLMNGNYIGPINLGNQDEYTISQLATEVQKLINPHAEVKYEALPQDDPRRRRPDISKARQLLGWEPKVPLPEGLKLTVADFQSRIQTSVLS